MSPCSALIFAAGRGERMRPLTDHTPKPLLKVQGQALISWHLAALARDGIQHVVINTAYLEEQFPPALGHGEPWGLRIEYSHEGQKYGGALETAGGMAEALPSLGQAFWALAGDVYVPGFRFDEGIAQAFQASDDWGWIWLVPNPPHVPQGDFAVDETGRVWRRDQAPSGCTSGTYSTIGLYKPEIVAGLASGAKAALRPYLERAIDSGKLKARWLTSAWTDVGTPERLAALNTP